MTPTKMPVPAERLLKSSEAAEFLRVSLSWLAKRRASGDGPPFIPMGRNIRYSQLALLHWTKSRQQLSIRDG
jgi:predicted DNA-binding transcriptional regulator AlpA